MTYAVLSLMLNTTEAENDMHSSEKDQHYPETVVVEIKTKHCPTNILCKSNKFKSIKLSRDYILKMFFNDYFIRSGDLARSRDAWDPRVYTVSSHIAAKTSWRTNFRTRVASNKINLGLLFHKYELFLGSKTSVQFKV